MITYENGREHLKYRVGSEEFYAIELKDSGKVIGNFIVIFVCFRAYLKSQYSCII